MSKCHGIIKSQQLEMGHKVGNKSLPGHFNFSAPDW